MDPLAPRHPAAESGLKFRIVLLIACVATLVAASLVVDDLRRLPLRSGWPVTEADPTPSDHLPASESRTTQTPPPSTRTAAD